MVIICSTKLENGVLLTFIVREGHCKGGKRFKKPGERMGRLASVETESRKWMFPTGQRPAYI